MMERAIYELLKDLCGGRVYALRAPQNSPDPFVIFQRLESERWRSINNPSGIAQATLQVDAYAQKYYDAKDVAAQIESILDGYRGTVTLDGDSPQQTVRIAGISLQSDSDMIDQTDEPLLFRNTASYLVTFEQ